MHIVVIGGTGHVGTYLVPRLVEAGHQVTVVSRGQREPYTPHGAWQAVQRVTLDRAAEETAGTFGARIRELKPDVVIDMICFTLESAQHLVEALRGTVQHFLHCSTVWVHEPAAIIPVTEDRPRRPIGDYGIKKAAIEAYLHREAHITGFPATCILPGHIVGPGWVPVNPAANFNPDVFSDLAQGRLVTLPTYGRAVLHHVHADDVAQLFMQALTHRNLAIGESFHALSPTALTLRGYAEAVAGWFGRTANLNLVSFEEWKTVVTSRDVDETWPHLQHSPHYFSIAKAQTQVGYQPRYTSLEAIYEAVLWLINHGIVKTQADVTPG